MFSNFFLGLRLLVVRRDYACVNASTRSAGREVLIKTVAQAIPVYAMQCFVVPCSILNEIEKLCRNFFWGQRSEERKMEWVGWEKIYASKK